MNQQPSHDDFAAHACWSARFPKERVAPIFQPVTAERTERQRAVVLVVAVSAEDGMRLSDRPPADRVDHQHCPESDLARSLYLRGRISGAIEPEPAERNERSWTNSPPRYWWCPAVISGPKRCRRP